MTVRLVETVTAEEFRAFAGELARRAATAIHEGSTVVELAVPKARPHYQSGDCWCGPVVTNHAVKHQGDMSGGWAAMVGDDIDRDGFPTQDHR